MATATKTLTVAVPYEPRPQQAEIHAGICEHRWSVCVCHRRFGKTVLAINQLQIEALRCEQPRARYAFIAPTFRQGKAAVWDYLVHYAAGIPGVETNISELRVDYPTGGQVRIYGADSPDSLRGLYFDGVVFDEYGLMPPNVFTEVVRPALADRQGWAVFLGTPAGKNQFYDVAKQAKLDPAWYFAEFKASQTGIIPPSELLAARAVMTQDEYEQEFECSFEAAVKGAIFSAELQAARSAGRVSVVPYDPVLPVDTDWDLGVGDATAIWFSQSLRGGELRIIDFYEASGHGLPHYAQVLRDKGYTYGTHWAPHDIQVRELASGRSRLEVAQSLGIRFQVVPHLPKEDQIHAARMLFPRCWFDAGKTQAGLEALQHYRWDYNSRLNEFKAVPVHDWASHAADAFLYLGCRQSPPKPKTVPAWQSGQYVQGQTDHGWMQ
jgi:phage terminase large subunit